MGGDVFGDAGGAGAVLDDALDATGREATEIARGVDGLEVAGIVEKEGRELVGAGIEIVGDAGGGGFADKDGAVFLTFATDDEFASVEVDGVAVEADEFGDAQAGAEK